MTRFDPPKIYTTLDPEVDDTPPVDECPDEQVPDDTDD